MVRAQILGGPERRRRWSDEQKRAIVAAAFAPGAVVSEVARRADLCSSLIYRWRRELAAARFGFSEVIVASAGDGGGAPGDDTGPLQAAVADTTSAIEVAVDGRARVRIPASVPPELAAAVITALVRR